MIGCIVRLCFAFLLLSGASHDMVAQGYIPTIVEGNHWVLHRPMGLGTYLRYDYELRCDTFINDRTYMILWDKNDEMNGFFREDTTSQEIFHIPLDSTNEYRVFSFSHEQGDTVFLHYGGFLVVDSVYYIELFGKERKVISFQSLYYYLEGVGSSLGLVYQNGPMIYYYVEDFYSSGHTCEMSTAVSGGVEEKPLSIYPNPVSEILYIETGIDEEVRCHFYSLDGRWLFSVSITAFGVVDMREIPSGLVIMKTHNGQVYKLTRV